MTALGPNGAAWVGVEKVVMSSVVVAVEHRGMAKENACCSMQSTRCCRQLQAATAAGRGGSRRKEREINPGVKMYSLNQFLEN